MTKVKQNKFFYENMNEIFYSNLDMWYWAFESYYNSADHKGPLAIEQPLFNLCERFDIIYKSLVEDEIYSNAF